MSTDLVLAQQGSIFTDLQRFEDAQRMAALLISSEWVPKNYRNVPDAVIALEMASRVGGSPLAIMQNTYIVHGKPAWSSQFLIACINASGKFSSLRYKETGDKGKDSWGCIAWATDSTGEDLFGPEVTISMAKAEGWHGKTGSKWQTMPELMLRYRAATFFARTYCPELTMGIQTREEVLDIEAHEVREPTVKVDTSSPFTAKEAKPETKPEPKKEAKPTPATIKVSDVRKALGNPPIQLLSGWLYDKKQIKASLEEMTEACRLHLTKNAEKATAEMKAWGAENGY